MATVHLDQESEVLIKARVKRDQLAVLLPGERSPERKLIDEAVRELNAMYSTAALQTACDMGEYVLGVFFNGDMRRFREKSLQHVSFRRLAARSDLQVSASFLWTAVAVLGQVRQLPSSVARALPLSHHRLLLAVKDQTAKTRMAQRAVKDQLTKRQLDAEVRQHQLRAGAKSRAGRPPLPQLIKRLNELHRSAHQLLALSDGDLKVNDRFLPEARELISSLTPVLARVEDRLVYLHRTLP